MAWDSNNVAHTTLWSFERWQLKNKSVTFRQAGEHWSVDYLIGVSPGEAPVFRKEKARAHAVALDEVFTDFLHAGYEAGVTQNMAIQAMAAVLEDCSKKLQDLGDPVSGVYLFQGKV